MAYLLGIDVGTTRTKSALFSVDGRLIDIAKREYGLTYPREGWVEQSAEDWWTALRETVNELLARNALREDIVAMSLSAQGGATVLLDERFAPLGNAVSWLDARARETMHILNGHVTPTELQSISGWNSLLTLSFPVVHWFAKTEPKVFSKMRFLATTVDYLNYRLTGTFAADYCSAAMTELLDIDRMTWSDRLLTVAGLTRENMPAIVPSGVPIDTLGRQAAHELGLPPHVVVVSGAHDQYCAGIGAGAVGDGDCVLSSGTAWVMLATTRRLVFDATGAVHPGIHVLGERYGLMTSVPSAGDSVNWFRRTFASETGLETLSELVGEVPAGAEGVLFVPKFTAKSGGACFLNLNTVHGRAHCARAVFEGVALANRRQLAAFGAAGVEVGELIMIGGGAQSSTWPRIVADVSAIPLSLPEQPEAACAGAALLAGAGAGVFSSLEEAARTFTGESRQIEPDSANRETYDDAYRTFLDVLDHV